MISPEPRLTYLGPAPDADGAGRSAGNWRTRLPWPFLIVVGLPTLLAVLYFGLIASPRSNIDARLEARLARVIAQLLENDRDEPDQQPE